MIFLPFECHLCLIFWFFVASHLLRMLVVSPLTPDLLSKNNDVCDICAMHVYLLCVPGYLFVVSDIDIGA
jgi:hypothetical protein